GRDVGTAADGGGLQGGPAHRPRLAGPGPRPVKRHGPERGRTARHDRCDPHPFRRHRGLARLQLLPTLLPRGLPLGCPHTPNRVARRGLQDRAPLSEPEEYGFPPPVGSQRTYLISHEEVKTLPKFLGKPIGRVDYKYVPDPHLVQAILSLDKLDLLADSHMIRMGNQMVSFRRAFLAAF